MTLSIKGFDVTLSISDTLHYSTAFMLSPLLIVLLNVIMLSVFILNAVVLNVIIVNAIRLSVTLMNDVMLSVIK